MSTAYAGIEDQSGGEAPQIALWVEQAKAGDGTAFHRLVDRFQPEIFRMIFYRTRSRMDAEDLTQDVFLRAYKNLGRLKSALVFRAWLYRIAVNRVRDHFRLKKFRSMFGGGSIDEETFLETEEMAVAPEATKNLDRQAFWKDMGKMLEVLSRMEKEVFLLRFLDDLSIKEITAALGKNESTVKTHLYRALNKVKAAADQMDGWMEGIYE